MRQSTTITLLVINMAMFLLTYIAPELGPLLALSPYGLLIGKWFWTPITYMFVHGGFNHILFNMLFLVFIAPSVENRMGSREFTAYYLVVGILAGLFSIFAYLLLGKINPIVGASGALYGVLLAFTTYFPRAQLMVFYVIPMRAPYALALFAGLDIFMQLRGGVGIAYLTHLSGLLFAYLYFVLRLKINPIKAMRQG